MRASRRKKNPVHPGTNLWGKIVNPFLNFLITYFPNIKHVKADILVNNQEFSLGEYGIPGKVMFTPGHTKGSINILLDSGEAFVGDIAMKKFPMTLRPGLSIFSSDLNDLLDSWKNLLSEGAEKIYPGNGDPFPSNIIKKIIE